MKKVVMVLIALPLFVPMAQCCTTAIVSGKHTNDGKPLLLKHRDTDIPQNKLMFFNDGKYDYIGLVDSPDTLGAMVWAGCNSAGFAIMNSANYNLNLSDTAQLKDQEGVLMKKALQSCSTVDEFEELLRHLARPLGVEANFGVIDARGGAAYFETGNSTYKKFDANDPATAPFGYLIRTNYAFTGDRAEDYGLIRYRTADELFSLASNTNSLSHDFVLQQVSRCLKHSLTRVDLSQNLQLHANPPTFVSFQDYIPRFSSSASVVVHGVKPGESPMFTTIWTILGFQLCSVAVPSWVGGGSNLPSVLSADTSGNAPLCSKALKLKGRCFPIQRESGRNYLNISAVVNRSGDGILQKLLPLETAILRETEVKLRLWQNAEMKQEDIQQYYRWIDKTIIEEYEKLFGL